MTINPMTVMAIIGMAVVTYATRVAGLMFAERLALSNRAQAAFDAIPAAVLVAIIAPASLTTGPAETIAAIMTCLAASRLPLLATIIVGVLTVVCMRLALAS